MVAALDVKPSSVLLPKPHTGHGDTETQSPPFVVRLQPNLAHSRYRIPHDLNNTQPMRQESLTIWCQLDTYSERENSRRYCARPRSLPETAGFRILTMKASGGTSHSDINPNCAAG